MFYKGRAGKTIAILLTAVFALSWTAGCNTKETEVTTSVTTTQTEITTQAPTATPTPTATPSPTPTIAHTSHQAIREYDALKKCSKGITGIAVFKDGDLAVTTRNDLINGIYNGSYDGSISIRVIDTKEDKEVGKVELNPTSEVKGVSADGRIIVYDCSDDTVSLWSKDLIQHEDIGKAESGCYYDQENDVLVFVRYGSVCKLGMDGTLTKFLDRMYGYYFEAYDPGSNSVIVQKDDDRIGPLSKYSLISLEDNSVTSLVEDTRNMDLMFCDGKPIVSYPYDKKSVVELRDMKDGKITSSYGFKGDSEIYSSPLSDKIIVKVTKSYNYNYVKRTLLIADPFTGKYADTGISLKDANQVAITYDKNTEHFFIADSVSGKDRKARIIELCPECFDYSEDIKEYELKPYERPEEKYKLGDNFKDLRKKADEMEKKYGVKILIGNEILNREMSYAYRLTSMENASWPDEYRTGNTDYALGVIDTNLSKYPEGFFEKFKDFEGEGGVCIALVDELINDNGNFVANGENIFRGSTSYIVLSANTIELTTAHHELWHATENIINIVDPELFDLENWNKLNPEGFKYTEDFETYDNSDYYNMCKNESFDPVVDDIYFARVYGTVNEREDKATIMETFVGNERYYDEERYSSCLDEMNSYPHIKAKIDYIGMACEKVFGYKYWEK